MSSRAIMTGTRLTATVVDRIHLGARVSDQLRLSPEGDRMYLPGQDPCAISVIGASNGSPTTQSRLQYRACTAAWAIHRPLVRV